jgi:DNA processing protein
MLPRPVWPEPAALRQLCRLIVSQYPVPRFTRDELQAVTDPSALPLRPPRPVPGYALPPSFCDPEALAVHLEAWRDTTRGDLLAFHDPLYPELLRQTSRPPLVLFVNGDARRLSQPAVAIVGCRAATPDACDWTRDLAGDLARCGVAVGSGLARGIDAAAHAGALAAGGATFAVLGNGTDVSYPPENTALQAEIARRGCIASELLPGLAPRAWHFPNRNRILAGLVRGVVVVQAEARSGALITARHGLDENREVMAVPGDVRDPRSRGPHALLRAGAALVEAASDVLDAIGWASAPAMHPGTSDPMRLLAQLEAPCSAEELGVRLGWTAPRVQQVLSELELAGAVTRGPDGRHFRTGTSR